MFIQNTNLNIICHPISEIKKKFIDANEILKIKFSEPTTLPIPEEAQPDIPRIIAMSSSGHSQLVASKEAISLTTHYDNQYNANWLICQEDLNSKIDVIFQALEKMGGVKYKFSGLITSIIWDEVDGDVLKYISEKLIKVTSKQPLYDVNCKLTYIIDKQYFVNITVGNARISDNINYSNAFAGQFKKDGNNTIMIVLEVNDRYAFNVTDNYYSSREKINEILNITQKVIGELKTLVEEGKVII